MLEWISHVIESTNSYSLLLPAFFLLGCISSVGSYCNIAAIGAIAGFAGASSTHRSRDSLIVALAFLFGIVLALTAIGTIAGFAGEVVAQHFGRYGKLLIGIISVLFGLMALNLLPFKLPKFDQINQKKSRSLFGVILFGLALGAGSIACSMVCCLPVLPVVLGVAVLQGEIVGSMIIMLSFALGYSIPLAVILLGISFGKWTLRASKFSKVINIVAGLLLLCVGFYFLATL